MPKNKKRRHTEKDRPLSLAAGARLNFVKKVYSVLSVQLTVTFLMVCLNFNFPDFQTFQINNQWSSWASFAGALISIVALSFGSVSQIFPINFIFLSIFTLCESYLITYICMMYTADSVLLSAAATLASTLGLTYHAMTTKQDYTSSGSVIIGFLYSVLCVLLSVPLINYLFLDKNSEIMNYAMIIAGISSIFILIDTQRILGGSHSQLTLDNYVLGSIILYMDIIQLFLRILKIFGKKKKK